MPKCKNCKDIFEPKQFNRKYCTKDECNNLYFEFLKSEQKRKWNKEKKVKKENLQTVQELLKLAQVVFNKWIRKRDQENNLPCISCLNPKPKKVIISAQEVIKTFLLILIMFTYNANIVILFYMVT